MKTPNHFKTTVVAQHSNLPARITEVETPHGTFQTPAFMPVGTRAVVNMMTTQDLRESGSEIILGGNTYHMLCKPGLEIIERVGGMHRFMDWSGPMLTDSGGFQIFSLSKNGKLCTIREDGAYFKHPTTGQRLQMTPQSSMHAQRVIGADIVMAFDQCTPSDVTETEALRIMERTHRWLLISKNEHLQNPRSCYGYQQAFFGIIQGGCFPKLREQSTEFILKLDPDGIAIGGEVIGFDMQKTVDILRDIVPMLPTHKTRYTMGVGLNPQDLLDVVKEGIDIFDCVAPTRNARHGALYHGHVVPDDHWLRFASDLPQGRLLIKKSIYATDDRPILEGCSCTTCQRYSRAYLHYLFKEKSPSYCHFASIHNVHVMQVVCQAMRNFIKTCSL